MLLSEAARTGRKFWRKCDPSHRYGLEGKRMVYFDPNDDEHQGSYCEIDAEMVVANDWEVEPRSVMVTSRDLRECIVLLGSKARSPADIVNHIIEELELDL